MVSAIPLVIAFDSNNTPSGLAESRNIQVNDVSANAVYGATVSATNLEADSFSLVAVDLIVNSLSATTNVSAGGSVIGATVSATTLEADNFSLASTDLVVNSLSSLTNVSANNTVVGATVSATNLQADNFTLDNELIVNSLSSVTDISAVNGFVYGNSVSAANVSGLGVSSAGTVYAQGGVTTLGTVLSQDVVATNIVSASVTVMGTQLSGTTGNLQGTLTINNGDVDLDAGQVFRINSPGGSGETKYGGLVLPTTTDFSLVVVEPDGTVDIREADIYVSSTGDDFFGNFVSSTQLSFYQSLSGVSSLEFGGLTPSPTIGQAFVGFSALNEKTEVVIRNVGGTRMFGTINPSAEYADIAPIEGELFLGSTFEALNAKQIAQSFALIDGNAPQPGKLRLYLNPGYTEHELSGNLHVSSDVSSNSVLYANGTAYSSLAGPGVVTIDATNNVSATTLEQWPAYWEQSFMGYDLATARLNAPVWLGGLDLKDYPVMFSRDTDIAFVTVMIAHATGSYTGSPWAVDIKKNGSVVASATYDPSAGVGLALVPRKVRLKTAPGGVPTTLRFTQGSVDAQTGAGDYLGVHIHENNGGADTIDTVVASLTLSCSAVGAVDT